MVSNILILSISGVLLILTCIIFKKSRKYRTNIKYLISSLVSIALANTAVGLNFPNLILMISVSFLLPFGIILLFSHYEGISRPHPRLSIFICLLIFLILSISFKIVILIYLQLNGFPLDILYSEIRTYNDDIFIKTLFHLSTLFQSLILSIVFIRAFLIIKKVLKIIKIKATIVELIGLGFLILYGFTFLIRDIFLYEYYDSLSSLGLIFALIGLLLVVYNFIMHPDYLYLLPFPIFKFIIFNESGISCYIRNIEKIEKSNEMDGDLDQLMA